MESISNTFIKEQKNLKFIAEKLNIDPFDKFPFDVHDFIYQHFTGIEILKMSEVSPAWYIEIGNSKVCMDKIKFNFFLKEDSLITMSKELVETKRKYTNVVIQWEHTGMSLSNRTRVIRKFASSVVYLEVRSMSKLDWKPVDLPKLTTLKFRSKDETGDRERFIPKAMIFRSATSYQRCIGVSPSFMEVVGQCNVKNLIIDGGLPVETIYVFITKRMNTLKLLNLDYWNTRLFFGDDQVESLHQLKRLKLIKLKLDISHHYLLNRFPSIINSFLKSQAGTLEHLAIRYICEEMLKTGLELPKLRIIEIDSYWPSTDTEWSKLPKSKSIVEVNISRLNSLELNILQNLLERMPKVKEMTLDHLNVSVGREVTDDILIISKALMNLENLYFKTGPSDINEKYEAIKQNADIIANHRIKLKRIVHGRGSFNQ